jgi:DNA-binding NtrC family response regulator
MVSDYEVQTHERPSAVVVPLRVAPMTTQRGMIVGEHPTVRSALGTLSRVAKASCTVLVTGESGTGKELFVAALHDSSARATGPLVAVNCGAIPEALIESELFGHAKGAFTGAHASRRGRVAEAEGGTLFLDEIGELPLAMQVKILRLLQQREYSPVGDSRVHKCNIRVVAATHRNLERDVADGRFREDLFYRLNVIQVHVPALRERSSDIPLLVEHFFLAAVERAGREDLEGFSPEAVDAMTRYEWPGNVRALENAVERAVLLSAGPRIEVADLPARIRGESPAPTAATTHAVFEPLPEAGLDLRATLDRYEGALIRQALERTGWNKNRAAQLLHMNRTTLVEMIKRKSIQGGPPGLGSESLI